MCCFKADVNCAGMVATGKGFCGDDCDNDPVFWSLAQRNLVLKCFKLSLVLIYNPGL